MTNKLSMRLYEPAQAHRALVESWMYVKAWLMAGHRLVLEIRPEKRSDRQNRLFHALLGDVSRQVEWMGKKRSPDEWKVLMVSGHAVATKIGADLVPGLEGEFLNIRESTARMNKSRMNSLIEYSMAWCVANDVVLRDAVPWIVDPETGEVMA
jgi:hypothetical protein